MKTRVGNKKIIVDDNGYIPRSRLNEVIEQRNTLKKDLESIESKIKETVGLLDEKNILMKELKNKCNELQSEREQLIAVLTNNVKNIESVMSIVPKSQIEKSN